MRNKLFLFIIFFAVVSCKNSQQTNNDNSILNEEKVINTRESFDFSITSEGVDKLILGMPFSQITSVYNDFQFEYFEDYCGYAMSNGNISLFLIVVEDTLTEIQIGDKRFYLENGLKVGSTVSEFRKLYPNNPIYFNHHDNIEYFDLKDDNLYVYLSIESKDGKLLGQYNDDIMDSTLVYDTNGSIIQLNIRKNEL